MAERQCLRCGAPYDEGATVCFTCGASIGELETPTQPVRAPKRPAPPTEPAPAQPAEPQGANSDATSGAVVATAAPGPTAPSRPLTVGGAGYRMAAAPPRPPRQIRWPLVIGLLVALVALATGGYFGARALLAGKPIPTTTTYTQTDFSFTRPALWTVTQNGSGALLTDSSGANSVTIMVATAQAGQTAGAAADSLAAQQGLQSEPTATIAGEQWQQRAGQVVGQDGATRMVKLYVDIHAGKLYTIETSSPTSVADSISSLVYKPLLASFSFR